MYRFLVQGLFFDWDAELVGGVEVCVVVEGLDVLGDECVECEVGVVVVAVCSVESGCVWVSVEVGGEVFGVFGEVKHDDEVADEVIFESVPRVAEVSEVVSVCVG